MKHPCPCTLFVPLAIAALFALALCVAEEPELSAYVTPNGEVVVSQKGHDLLKLAVIAWGPKWAWTGLDEKVRAENGSAIGTFTGKMGGTNVPFRIDFHATCPDPQRLRVNYELKADAETGVTLVVVELTPGAAFEGREVHVTAGGTRTGVRCPFEKRGLGRQVAALEFTDAGGAVTSIRLDPACDIASDGPARIVLAQEKLPANEPRRLSLEIDLPAAAKWYPNAAEMPSEPGAESWYVWQAKSDTSGESPLGLQDWLDKPAGRHGRIARQGDRLVYDGQPIRLWGLNLCYSACAPEKELAERRAAFYAKYGINSVRLHKYADGTGWAGIQSQDSFVEFDPAGLDRMDYQIAKFKEHGIYVKLSAHFGSQKLGPADKKYVPFVEEFGRFEAKTGNRIETPHSALHYSPELQEVQILHTVNLLKHRNPHTGLTYAEDPAIAFIEIVNEQSILFYTSMNPLKASATLRARVGARFCEWLKKKYGNAEQLQAAWGAAAFDCFANEGFRPEGGESLERGTLLPLGNPWFWDPAQLEGSQKPKRQRLLDSLQFLYELQCEFFAKYVKALREAGYRGEIVGSNWQAGRAYSHFANLHSDYLVGTIDRHNYFGGAKGNAIHNASMLARAGSGILSAGMQQVADRPFMLSEWIHCYPTEWGVEGPAIVGAYGLGLQGWDVSHLFQNRDPGTFMDRIGAEQWNVTVPQILGVFPAVARQIHRGDVKQSETDAPRNVHVPSLFEGKLGFEDRVVQGYDEKELDSSTFPARALAVARGVVRFTERFEETPVFDLKPFEKDGALVSTTGQLRWYEGQDRTSGYFTMDTEGTKAVVGFADGRKAKLGAVTIEPQSRFAAIYVTARAKDRTVENAGELLVVAIARARNTGMRITPAGDRLMDKGKPPIVMEPVKARIALARAGTPKVFLLDHDGRLTERTVAVENGAFAIDGARDRTPYYLIRYP